MAFPSDEPGYPGAAFPLEPFDASFGIPVRPRKFQNRLWLHVVLLILTICTTTMMGIWWYLGFASASSGHEVQLGWWLVPHGLWYSGAILAILGAHEMGHYLLCRRYNVDASLPYFIPIPFVLTGTLGAVIRIREAFPTRRILFDIGIAGPIAGFVVLLPVLFYGLSLSNVVPEPTQGQVWYFGEPLLFKLATYLVLGPIKDGYTANLHPTVWAAWFGMLATALNLLPFGQFDGGHITYATLGRWSAPISIATAGTAIVMAFISTNWILISVIMLVMLYMLGPRHPRVIDEQEAIGMERKLLAIFALVMFILCFTPVPVRVLDLVGPR